MRLSLVDRSNLLRLTIDDVVGCDPKLVGEVDYNHLQTVKNGSTLSLRFQPKLRSVTHPTEFFFLDSVNFDFTSFVKVTHPKSKCITWSNISAILST